MKKIPNRYFFILVIVLFIITVWYIGDNGMKEYSDPILPEASLSNLPEDLENTIGMITARIGDKGDSEGFFTFFPGNKITAETPLVFQTYYQKSDEISEYVTGMPPSFIGLTTEQLKEAMQEWSIKKYEPQNALILYRSKDDLLPEDKNNQHLGMKDGKVVIFYGKKDKKNKTVKRKTDIDIADLPEKEIAKLEEGITIKSEEELFTILEGLLSYKQD